MESHKEELDAFQMKMTFSQKWVNQNLKHLTRAADLYLGNMI